MLLAGDVGGTKTVVALIDDRRGPHAPVREKIYASAEFASLSDIVMDFIRLSREQPTSATFGVAGPVHGPVVRVTNLAWEIDSQKLSQKLDGAPVYLLNDLEAIANSISAPQEDDLASIKEGQVIEHGPVAVVAPGTGLGEAFLFWDGRRYRPIPSEGGHTDFAPATPLELALLTYMQEHFEHVSYERVCSGIGIPNLYAFFRDTGRYPEPEWLKARLLEARDKTPIIINAAVDRSAAICEATLDLFLSILGSEAGNLVLQILATGGVYLAGGIPPRILPQLRSRVFLDAFTRKGRFANLLWTTPVKVIVNPKAALYGAANHGLVMAHSEEEIAG